MRPLFTLIALALALPAQAAPADEVAKLAWMSGRWIEDTVTTTTQEVWTRPGGGVMAGASQTNAPGRKSQVEHMTITAEAAGVTFTAILPGQPPTPFVLKPGGAEGEAVFENLAHDFPQRVIYQRCGVQLCARIEGVVKGQPVSKSWIYRRLD